MSTRPIDGGASVPRSTGAILAPFLSRHSPGIALISALFVGSGVLAYRALPRGLYPELSFPRVAVVGTLPDATAEIVLLNLTRPLEEALTPVLGVRRVRSKSIRGAVEISVLFEPNTDMVVALQLVQARLGEVRGDIPPAATLVAERVTPTSFPILTLNVDGPAPPATLRDIALYQVRPALSRVPGVGLITVTAGEPREVEIEIDPGKAEAAGLEIDAVAKRIDENNRFATVGRIDRAYRRNVILIDGHARNPEELSQILVGGTDTSPIRLGDIAQIREGHADPRLVVRSPRGPAAVVNVARRIGGDVTQLDRDLHVAIENLRKQLPAGIELTVVYQQAELIEGATGAVRDAILFGALLSAIVLFFFLRDGRATLIAALAIPGSLLAACSVIAVFRGSLNLMSLGGMAIAVGLVIDDAVVVVEVIHREMELGKTPRQATEIGLARLAGPIMSSTLTTVVVFAPLGFLSGVVGTFFSALALALSAAVLASLVLALSVIPLLSMRWLRPVEHRAKERLAERYHDALVRSLDRRKTVLATTVVIMVVGLFAARSLETDFIPQMDEGAFVFDYFAPIGTSLQESDALSGQIDDILRADPDVETFTRRLGAEIGPPRATETSRGDFTVRLKKKRDRSVFEIMADHRRIVAAKLPGMRIELIQLLQDMLGDLAGNPEPIEIKIFGGDEPELRRQAKRISDAIHDVAGLTDLFDGQVACSPERVLRIDPVRAGRVGLTTKSIADQVGAVLLGAEVAPVPENDRLIPVRVRWPDRDRFDDHALERLKIHAPSGSWVPLVELAKIDDGCVPSEIARENLRLMVPVTARLEGRDLGSAVAEVQSRLSKLEMPRGYSFEIGGQSVSQGESFRELALALGAALALVLVVLVFQFGTFEAPLAILAAIPVALAGGVAALLIARIPLNVSSLLGAILLVGLVVKNGILFLHRAAEKEAEGESVEEALADAGRVRLRPILMTTICTLVGLFPLALGLGAGAEMHRPLAVAVLGGLSLSTLGTLFAVPAVYASLRKRKRSAGQADG